MLIFNDINWLKPGVKEDRISRDMYAKSIALVIDSQIVKIIIIDEEYLDFFINAVGFEESPYQTDEASGLYAVDFVRSSGEKETLICDEMLHAIFLSKPQVIYLTDRFKNYKMLREGWYYIDEEFIVPGID